jgi:hypothetical protein
MTIHFGLNFLIAAISLPLTVLLLWVTMKVQTNRGAYVVAALLLVLLVWLGVAQVVGWVIGRLF